MEQMFRIVVLVVLATLVVATLPFVPAYAQGINRCGLRTGVVAALEQRHQEAQTALGLTAKGNLMEVFASPSGSWTIIQTSPHGVSCVVAAGTRWTQYTWPPKEEEPTA
jgi:hypothetical protein